jgi:hypothetical protein
LLMQLVGDSVGVEAASRMRQLFAAGAPNVKELDARMLVERMRRDDARLA